MMPFQMTPRPMTLTLTFVLKIAFLDFVASMATGGIVFHKHMYFLYNGNKYCMYEKLTKEKVQYFLATYEFAL